MANSKRMKGTDNKLLTEEHTELIREAESLGVSTFGLKVKGARLDHLRELIVKAQEEKATGEADITSVSQSLSDEDYAQLIALAQGYGILFPEDLSPDNWAAINELRMEIAAEELLIEKDKQEEQPTQAPTIDDTQEVVLVRVAEWTDWIPANPSNGLMVNNGITSFKTAKSERLLEVAVSGTGQTYVWEQDSECEDCGGDGEVSLPEDPASKVRCQKCEGSGKTSDKIAYGLYAFQAILAVNNILPDAAENMKAMQFAPMKAELERAQQSTEQQGRDRRSDLTIVERVPPNRDQRRGNNKKPPRRHR